SRARLHILAPRKSHADQYTHRGRRAARSGGVDLPAEGLSRTERSGAGQERPGRRGSDQGARSRPGVPRRGNAWARWVRRDQAPDREKNPRAGDCVRHGVRSLRGAGIRSERRGLRAETLRPGANRKGDPAREKILGCGFVARGAARNTGGPAWRRRAEAEVRPAGEIVGEGAGTNVSGDAEDVIYAS